jgi:tetratricopeptide (TPR) repeat protein
MARKLSRFQRGLIPLVTVPVAWICVASACADGDLNRSAPPILVQNPFAATNQPSVDVEPTPQPQRRAIIYQNPFATENVAPPVESRLTGPRSRWRRPALPSPAPPLQTAIISANPIDTVHVPWDQLPPGEVLRDRAEPRNFVVNGSDAAGFPDPHEPNLFAPAELSQPALVSVSAETAQLLPPIGQVSFDQPPVNDPLGSAASNVLHVAPVRGHMSSFVISDYADSAEGWLAQARQAAQTALSADDLSIVVDSCRRGLDARPSAELSSELRRLAAWGHNRRGELLIEAGLESEATNDFESAISLDSTCSLAIHNRAVTLAEQNDFATALRDFNRVIELNPGLAVAYRNRAELLAALGQLKEAMSDYNRAIEAMPDDAELYRARGHALQRLGDFEGAKADLNRLMQLAPRDPHSFTQRGNFAAERGNFEEALVDFRQAQSIDPNSAEAHRSLAWLLATCPDERYRNSDLALKAAQLAAKLSPPEDYLALDTLAAANACARRFGQAAELQCRAIAAAPADAAGPLRQRLALYQRNQPYRNGAASAAR